MSCWHRAPSWHAGEGPVVVVVAEVYLTLAIVLLITVGGPKGLHDQLAFRYTTVRDIFLALGVWLTILCAIVLAFFVLSPFIGPTSTSWLQLLRLVSDMPRLRSADPTSTFFIVARACLIAPFVEEIAFRGALFAWLRTRMSAAPTIVLSAAAFAAIHFYPAVMPIAFLFGLGAAWVRERTGSSFNFFVAHVADNVLFLGAAYWEAFRT